jgi:hypothetical protein
MGVTGEAGIAYPSRAREFTYGFDGVPVAPYFVFCVCRCVPFLLAVALSAL